MSAFLLCGLLAVSLFEVHEHSAASTAQRSTSSGDEAMVFVLPPRRAAEAPPTVAPVLPPGSERITPLTLHVTIRRRAAGGRELTLQQTIVRTAERIHVNSNDGREWLFERNVRDPRRLSGSLIEHAPRTIITYEESDLRNVLGIDGWANVLTLGFDVDQLKTLKHTGEARTIAGIRFSRYATERKNATMSSVWWSEDQLFPSAFESANGTSSTRLSVERIQTTADADLLRSPDSRFPAYHVVELADWLERH